MTPALVIGLYGLFALPAALACIAALWRAIIK